MPATHKPIPIRPLTGPLEVRIPPDQMKPEMMRFRQNFCCDENGSLDRSRGFSKFLDGNCDLHDQLLPLQTYYDFKSPRVEGDDAVSVFPNSSLCDGDLKTRANGRETINFGLNVKTDTGGRRTIVGTRSRIYALNETTKNYRIIGDGFGGATERDIRFYGAHTNNTVVFTNGVDQPVAWPVDGVVTGCEMQAVQKIKDLDLIGLDAAGFVCEFDGCIFLFDITLDGVRFPNGYVWSDLRNGVSFDPATPGTIAGEDEVAPGHTILYAEKLFDYLVIYTDKGMFKMTATGATPPFINGRSYVDESGYRCLRYRNTVVNLGDKHFYVGADGCYINDPYSVEPERTEWMHSASGIMFKGISGYDKIQPSACETTVAGFKPDYGDVDGEGEIYLSWAEPGHNYPTKTLVFNTRFEVAYSVDHGFSAFFNHVADGRISVRDFLLKACACNRTELELLGLGFIKEAQPVDLCAGGDAIKCILTKTIKELAGFDTEDWDASPDSDSMCAYLDGLTDQDICGPCRLSDHFVGASTEDLCLKEIGKVYYREICTNSDTVTGTDTDFQNLNGVYSSFVGEYAIRGYFSILRGAPQCFNTRTRKIIERFLAEVDAATQSYPCAIQLRIGMQYRAADPNDTSVGGPVWYTPERRYLQRVDTLTPQQYADQNIIPNTGIEWPLGRKGIWIYWELTIGNLSDNGNLNSTLLPATGGACSISGIWQTIRQESGFVK